MEKSVIRRANYLLVVAVVLVALPACASETQQPPTPTPVPSSPTLIPSSTSTPTEIPPTLTPSPSPAPTFTSTPEPQFILLRGASASGCKREHSVVANKPIRLHYGVWGSVGKEYADNAWDLLDITLTIDGEEIVGEKQPVAADLVNHCGIDAEDSYWVYYMVDIEGLPPGDYYLEVTYYANGVIPDGWGVNHGPGTILTHSYFIHSATEE